MSVCLFIWISLSTELIHFDDLRSVLSHIFSLVTMDSLYEFCFHGNKVSISTLFVVFGNCFCIATSGLPSNKQFLTLVALGNKRFHDFIHSDTYLFSFQLISKLYPWQQANSSVVLVDNS